MLIQTETNLIISNTNLIKPIPIVSLISSTEKLEKRRNKRKLINYSLLIIILSLLIITPNILNNNSNYSIFSYLSSNNWFIDILTLTDIQTLGYTIFLINPLIIIIIGILLWLILIGILCLCN